MDLGLTASVKANFVTIHTTTLIVGRIPGSILFLVSLIDSMIDGDTLLVCYSSETQYET